MEPVSLEDAKVHMKVDGDSEDMLIASLIITSRLHIEAALGISLNTQRFKLVRDRWPSRGAIRIPIRPLQSIDEIRVLDGRGGIDIVDPDKYEFDLTSAPPRLVWTGGPAPRPGKSINGLEIDLVAGYGTAADDVPAPLRQGLMMLVAHWYEHRDPIEIGSQRTTVPAAVTQLIKPYRLVRL